MRKLTILFCALMTISAAWAAEPLRANSRRIAEKCGYRLEGTFRKFGFCRGEYQDHEVLALLREDCPSLAKALRS